MLFTFYVFCFVFVFGQRVYCIQAQTSEKCETAIAKRLWQPNGYSNPRLLAKTYLPYCNRQKPDDRSSFLSKSEKHRRKRQRRIRKLTFQLVGSATERLHLFSVVRGDVSFALAGSVRGKVRAHYTVYTSPDSRFSETRMRDVLREFDPRLADNTSPLQDYLKALK